MARPRRLKATIVLMVLAVAGLVVIACTRQPGQPRPVPSSTTDGAEPSTTVTSVNDLDLCQLLTPEDFPFEPDGRFPPRQEFKSTGCRWFANKDGPTSSFITHVAVQEFTFEEYKPPPLAPNGRFTEIAGRPAWVGTSLPAEVDASCGTTFGAADGSVTVILLDQTENRPEPCVTLVELAEIVASRTPAPTK